MELRYNIVLESLEVVEVIVIKKINEIKFFKKLILKYGKELEFEGGKIVGRNNDKNLFLHE